MYETFDHTADLGLRVAADDLPSLLAEAGRGLASMIVLNIDAVEPRVAKRIEVEGDDPEYLLFDWLNELLFLFEQESLLLVEFDIAIANGKLTAEARGEPVDRSRHDLHHEVKAITYHGLMVEQTSEGWRAEVIVDI